MATDTLSNDGSQRSKKEVHGIFSVAIFVWILRTTFVVWVAIFEIFIAKLKLKVSIDEMLYIPLFVCPSVNVTMWHSSVPSFSPPPKPRTFFSAIFFFPP